MQSPVSPPPLTVAAGLVFVEALLSAMYGIAEAVHITANRAVMGATTAGFFVLCAVGLAFCAWGLTRLHTWARGPVLLTQLIALGLAWNFRDGGTWPIAAILAVPAVLTLIGMLHPASIAALNPDAGPGVNDGGE